MNLRIACTSRTWGDGCTLPGDCSTVGCSPVRGKDRDNLSTGEEEWEQEQRVVPPCQFTSTCSLPLWGHYCDDVTGLQFCSSLKPNLQLKEERCCAAEHETQRSAGLLPQHGDLEGSLDSLCHQTSWVRRTHGRRNYYLVRGSSERLTIQNPKVGVQLQKCERHFGSIFFFYFPSKFSCPVSPVFFSIIWPVPRLVPVAQGSILAQGRRSDPVGLDKAMILAGGECHQLTLVGRGTN